MMGKIGVKILDGNVVSEFSEQMKKRGGGELGDMNGVQI